MNYRHAFHAGNFADVIKHLTLVGILLHLRKKEKAFCVIDSHAGHGLYNIAGETAARTGEAAEGAGRLTSLAVDGLPAALRKYLEVVREWGADRYPGSPLIAARLLREQDRLIAIERHPEEAGALRNVLAGKRNAKVECADGYVRLSALLPPPERRGLILIDPPYESDDEFARVAAAVAVVRKRFATGIFLVWYPVKSAAAADALAGEIRAGGAETLLRVTIDVGAARGGDEKERLQGAGLLVVNPPYGLSEEMVAARKVLAPRLGRTAPAQIAVENI